MPLCWRFHNVSTPGPLLFSGTAAQDLLTDRTKLATAVGGFTALFLGIYGARESTRVVGRTVERWLGTPKLVGGM